MTPVAVIETYRSRGVLLWRDGDQLRYQAPKGVLTPTVIANLKASKERILPYLPASPYPRLEGNHLPPDQHEAARNWIQKQTVDDDPNPLSDEDVAELQSLLVGFPEGLYKGVVWAEWDGKRHTVYCAGWAAPVVTEI